MQINKPTKKPSKIVSMFSFVLHTVFIILDRIYIGTPTCMYQRRMSGALVP